MLESRPIIRLGRLVISHSPCILAVLSAHLPSFRDTFSSCNNAGPYMQNWQYTKTLLLDQSKKKKRPILTFILKMGVSESDLIRQSLDIFLVIVRRKIFISILSFLFMLKYNANNTRTLEIFLFSICGSSLYGIFIILYIVNSLS